MGLFDQIEGFASRELHSALGQTRFGGLDGLLQHLSQSGMGGEVASWQDPDQPNQPISANQVGQALGGGELEKIAASFGVQPQVATELLAKLLPQATSKSQE
jgi:uncharacterized protein YidB (DUF937 family)